MALKRKLINETGLRDVNKRRKGFASATVDVTEEMLLQSV